MSLVYKTKLTAFKDSYAVALFYWAAAIMTLSAAVMLNQILKGTLSSSLIYTFTTCLIIVMALQPIKRDRYGRYPHKDWVWTAFWELPILALMARAVLGMIWSEWFYAWLAVFVSTIPSVFVVLHWQWHKIKGEHRLYVFDLPR